MAKTADGRKNKRQKLSESADSSVKDAKTQEESPVSMRKDRSLQLRSKSSPSEVAIRVQRDATSMPLSIRKQGIPGENEERGAKVLSSVPGQHSSSAVSRKKAKSSMDAEDLRVYIQMQGGMLEDGWQVDLQRRPAGKLIKTFISPNKERFRSRIEVAKHLGLDLSLKQGEVPKPNSERGFVEQNNSVLPSKETVNLVTMWDKKSSKIPGKRKEYISILPTSHKEATKNTNNGLVLASDTSKAIVPAQKPPETSTVTQRCQNAFRSIISTDNFAALSNMLNRGSASGSLESPLQIKALPLIAGSLDLQLIHLRLSNGVYGQTPELFSTDIQQVWKNITAAGNELVTLAQSLSQFSNKVYNQEISSLFQGAASEETLQRTELPVSTSQRGNHLIENSRVSLDNSGILIPPAESSPTKLATLLETGTSKKKETPLNQGARGDVGESPFKQAGAVYESRKRPKKATKSEKLTVKVLEKHTPEVCKSCGLHQQGKACIKCKHCSAVFHSQCVKYPLKNLGDIDWCCPSCAASEVAVEAPYESKNSEPLEATDLKKSMVCPEDAHQNNTHPEGHNYSVCNRISTGSLPLVEENPSSEQAAPENPSAMEDVRSLDHSSGQGVVLKPGVENESSVENGPSPDPGFLLENENICKVCRVESKKPVVSCAWCAKKFHLLCLRPPLKKLPRKTWFCPSCLCRACKVDVDDDQILLCDRCDEGYHTYCLNPPLSEKPEGSWFCSACAKNAEPNAPKQPEVLKRKRKSTEPRRST